VHQRCELVAFGGSATRAATHALLVALGLCVVASCGESGRPPANACICTPPKWTTLDLVAGRPGGPGWVDGTLVAAHFVEPWALASDARGHLYVADGRYTVRAIDVAAGSVETLAGVYGQIGASDGAGVQATFNLPSGLAFSGGQLYLADTENGTIRRIDLQTGAVTTVAGTAGQTGALDGIGADAQFAALNGLVADASGNLYVGDTENDTIRKLDPTGAVSTIAGMAGTPGSDDGVGAAARFRQPKALTLDAAGLLYVVDSLNQSIRKVDPTTGAVSTLTTFADLPQGVAVDSGDVLVSLTSLVADRIVRVASDGTVTPLAGGAKGFLDGTGDGARFDSPAGLWNDGAGTLYVADSGNEVIRRIALASGAVSTFAGAQSSGAADGVGAQARFSSPARPVLQGIAADDRAAYVADTGNDTVRKILMTTGEVSTLAGGVGLPDRVDGAVHDARFNQPEGLALDSAGQKLYVADTNNRSLRRIDLGAGAVTTLALVAAPGDPFAGFDGPAGLALAGGRLFVTDYSDHVVLAVDVQAGRVSTFAGKSGVPGPSDGVGTSAAFYGPLGIASDGQGNLYVADDLNQTIRKIEIATAKVTTLAGQQVIAGSSDGVGVAAHFHGPFALAADGAGDLFVSDLMNNTVRRIEVSSGAVTTVIGSVAASGVRLGPLPSQLTQPSALALTPSGGLLVLSENAVLLAR
jgi:sugar lactone lactonase YvrE